MPRRDLIMAACGLILLGTGLGFSDRKQAEADIVLASISQTRALSLINPLDSRLRPDGLPIIVPAKREMSI